MRLHGVGLQLAHELHRLCHDLGLGLHFGVDLVVALLQLLLLENFIDDGTINEKVLEVDLLPGYYHPVVEVEMHVG